MTLPLNQHSNGEVASTPEKSPGRGWENKKTRLSKIVMIWQQSELEDRTLRFSGGRRENHRVMKKEEVGVVVGYIALFMSIMSLSLQKQTSLFFSSLSLSLFCGLDPDFHSPPQKRGT